jgi:membrane-associated phospholipid phosphatase
MKYFISQDITNWDIWLLKKINLDWTHPWLDVFFTSITDYHKSASFYYIFLPLFFASLIYVKKKSSVKIILFLILSLSFTDFLSGKILKEFFQRLRPPVEGIEVILRAPHFGGLSFPSNHAVNIFCAATFLSFYFPGLRYPLFIFAGCVAYSRVYVGVHYPLDVLSGAILGFLIGYLFFLLSQKIRRF